MVFIKKYYYLFTGLVVFIVYIFTLAPSVVQIDSGELAAVQATLGIAHPTGYPLFTILGYLFSLIPLPMTKIFQLNLLAAIYSSTGIAVFVYTAKLVLDNLTSFSTSKVHTTNKNKKKSEKEKEKIIDTTPYLTETIKYIIAITGGLSLAFSETYWLQSTSVEVYSLHIFLMNIIILSLVKAFLYVEKKDDKTNLKLWLIFSVFLALGFTNHMTTLLIIPGAVYLFLSKNKFDAASIKKIFLMLIVFFSVLFLIYSYLPIRALQNPVLNWGNPQDIERILRHVTGKQYQVWLFASIESAKLQFIHFIETMPGQFSVNLVLFIIGIFASYIYAKKFFIFLVTSFLFTVLYSINYEIHDIDPYFLLAYVMISFFIVFGLLKFFSFVKLKSLEAIIAIVVVFISIQFYTNINKVNQNEIYTYEDYTRSILNSVSPGGIIFSYQWDYFISASYYFRFVENYRKDVAVVDKEILRRSWYYDQLNKNYPYLLKDMQDDIKRFKEALVPFERSEGYNSNLLENLYRRVMTNLVEANIDERDFYIAPELFENEMKRGEFTLPQGYSLIPDVLLFKVVKSNEYIPAANPDFNIRISDKRNYYIDKIEYFVGSMLSRRAMYEMQYGKVERAKVYLKKIQYDLPTYKIPPHLQKLLKQN
ncbi:MAG: hypothetical protein BMS9Abin39_0282 [Ignavibacteria bacterium]|nr:MAG: hypothetical protein BMS9Abin39_0282 [Ignavibacteria bacterium]